MEWILKTWNDLRKDVIMSSFKSCGLNTDVDCSEEHLIHCFKNDQTCSARGERLNGLARTIEDGREDPFSSLEESDVYEWRQLHL